MSVQDIAQLLGNFGEFFGAIAVIVTLIYLAVQVRQNKTALNANALAIEESRRQARSEGVRQLTARWDEINRLACGNSESAAVFLKGCRNLGDLDDVEQAIFYTQIVPFFNHHLHVLQMAQSGFLREDIVGEDIPHILDTIIGDLLRNNPGVRQWWEDWQFGWPHREHINALLAQPADPDRATIGQAVVRSDNTGSQ